MNFKNGRTSIENDENSGYLLQYASLVENHWQSINDVFEALGLSYGAYQKML